MVALVEVILKRLMDKFDHPDQLFGLVVATVVTIYLVWTLVSKQSKGEKAKIFKNLASKKRAERDNKYHKCLEGAKWNNETDPDLFDDMTSMLIKYQKKNTSCEKMVRRSVERSHNIGLKKLNAVTEELYDEAIESAKDMDANKNIMAGAPMRGIPISIKDCTHQKGCDTTCGMASRCLKPMPEDGLLVKLLRDAGAIPFVRSNVPQLLMMSESCNDIFGVTQNAWDPSRTCGGSSGGEAALVASGCSVIGLGSDIGGSIRTPAAWNGIVGFKPTPTRITQRGALAPVGVRNGQKIVLSSYGPMARSVRDCVTVMEVYTSATAAAQDPTIPPVPWKGISGPKGRKLRIGIITDDGFFKPVAAVQRAVEEAGDALKGQGHAVVPFKVPVSGAAMVKAYIGLLSADGNWYSFQRALQGEPLMKAYQVLLGYMNIPNFLRGSIGSFLQFTGEHRKADILLTQKSGGLSVREYWEHVADVKIYQEAYKSAMEAQELDALILPPCGVIAMPHNMSCDMVPVHSYAFLANILHTPAGVVPVTRVRKDECCYDKASLPDKQRDSFADLAHKCMQGATGMPVAVQVMAPAWGDELCLHVMGEIEKGVKYNHNPSY